MGQQKDLEVSKEDLPLQYDLDRFRFDIHRVVRQISPRFPGVDFFYARPLHFYGWYDYDCFRVLASYLFSVCKFDQNSKIVKKKVNLFKLEKQSPSKKSSSNPYYFLTTHSDC